MRNHPGAVTASIAFFGIAILVPASALAQRAPARVVGGMVRTPVRTFSRPAPVTRLAPATGVRVNVGRSTGRSAPTLGRRTARHGADASEFNGGLGTSGANLQELLNITPNSGFNWEHVNAINRDLGEKALIDPVTQLEIAQAERLLRSTGGGTFGGGAYILGGYPYYTPSELEGEQANLENEPAQAEQQSAPNAQPQIIVLQQAPSRQSAAPATQSAAAQFPATTEEQVPDRGELTLVLRNGKQVKALAFTDVNGQIVYITPDGSRTTIEAADLDSAATVLINQERGTPLQLPR
jgi:hypothetical protein